MQTKKTENQKEPMKSMKPKKPKDQNGLKEKDLKKSKPEEITEEALYDLAELFRVFGDSTRIRILFSLFQSELCVNDLAERLNMTQSAISHQLKLLRLSRLVGVRREGKQSVYFLKDDHVRTIIDQGREHIEE